MTATVPKKHHVSNLPLLFSLLLPSPQLLQNSEGSIP